MCSKDLVGSMIALDAGKTAEVAIIFDEGDIADRCFKIVRRFRIVIHHGMHGGDPEI